MIITYVTGQLIIHKTHVQCSPVITGVRTSSFWRLNFKHLHFYYVPCRSITWALNYMLHLKLGTSMQSHSKQFRSVLQSVLKRGFHLAFALLKGITVIPPLSFLKTMSVYILNLNQITRRKRKKKVFCYLKSSLKKTE